MTHRKEDTVYGRNKTVPNSDTVSSKLHLFKEDERRNRTKVHSWGLTVEGKQLQTRQFKCSPDLCSVMHTEFPHLIVPTRGRVYSKFPPQIRKEFRYSEE